jgi:hypothetical protein
MLFLTLMKYDFRADGPICCVSNELSGNYLVDFSFFDRFLSFLIRRLPKCKPSALEKYNKENLQSIYGKSNMLIVFKW